MSRQYGTMVVVPTYRCLVDGFGYTIQFVRLNDDADGAHPGFTHRVIVNKHTTGFLVNSDQPSKRTARFFLDKHLDKQATKEG